jgi:CRP/FNR family cyclic AMP-dependent transcriptional regulator
MARSTVTKAQSSLAGVAILARLPPEALESVERRCAFRRYEPGESIVGYLDQSDEVFFIISGEVRVTIYSLAGKVVSFRELGPGEVFGEYPAIDRGPRSASVEAHTSCEVATLPGAAFRELLETEPVVAQAMLPQLVTKMEGKGARIAPAPTHTEIAARVSTHREAVTRELTRLARIGLIEREKNALVVTDLERLAEMVHAATSE